MILNNILQILTILMLLYIIFRKANEGFSLSGGKKKSEKELLIDTSILIDGRILSVAKTGFMGYKLIIPRSVVGELQLLADGGSDEKRSRARYGLDIISELQHVKNLDVEILQDGTSASEGVDNRLISLAKDRGSAICTADFNLNKVAKVEGVRVLNINELAQSVRAKYLPGEKLTIELSQKGNEKKQAIGHLPDGTMVVVENAEKFVGELVEVEFIRIFQTAAGKMMFAKLSGAKTKSVQNPKNAGRKPVVKSLAKVESKKTVKKVEKQPVKNQKPTKEKAEPKPKQANRKRRKSPEDSMVELANK